MNANRYSWYQNRNPESGGRTAEHWADSNLRFPRGVNSEFKKQKKGTSLLPCPKPELKVLMIGQNASGGRGHRF